MKEQLNQLNPVLWEIPKNFRNDMRVPAHVYASPLMLEQIYKDKSLQQLINVTTLPGIQEHAVVMPDVHEGYGFPIGAVAATDLDDGVISPGGIGYDINCGIRLLKTDLTMHEIRPYIEKLSKEIYKAVPSGVGKEGKIKLKGKEMDKVLNLGCIWAEAEGYANENDLEFIESYGSLSMADASRVSESAKERGFDQLGTMGAGNHFIEIDKVQQIMDIATAEAFGLKPGQVVILIHTGSRGLGHQVATDYIKQMLNSMEKYKIKLPDRELSCAPIDSPIGKSYFAAMCAGANFAWTNRQLITWEIREAWRKVFGTTGGNIELLYDVAHNIAKVEEHKIDETTKKVLVHRKGSTRAFPSGHAEIPVKYKSVGQPVLIPGSMGTASYVLAGMEGSMAKSFGSACHGSGRLLSRTAAKKKIDAQKLKNDLNSRGIFIQTNSLKGLSEEAPDAYKDVESVVDVVEEAGIARKVARLVPLAVIKG